MLTAKSRVDRVRFFIQSADYNDPRHREAMIRGLGIIVGNQTSDELIDKSTKHHNGRGFNGRDAGFGTSVYQNAQRYGFSPKQFASVKRMLVKYARQIAEHTANQE